MTMDIEVPFSKNEQLRLQILALEQTQPRTLRECVLSGPGALARLKALDDQIAALRAQMT